MLLSTTHKDYITKEACDLFNKSIISGDGNYILKPDIYSALRSEDIEKYKNHENLKNKYRNFKWHCLALKGDKKAPYSIIEMSEFISEVIEYYAFYTKEQKNKIINQKIKQIEKDFK